ncbi:MAG: hypothetical protein JO034_20665 [Singulisphaera sp.]|nr:hypothetical protein [Singulisphaera sp.]
MADPNRDGSEELLHLEDLHVGRRFVSGTHRIDEGQIKAFAKQFDPQPFHLDAEAAKETLFEGLVASGWHTAAVSIRVRHDGPLLQDRCSRWSLAADGRASRRPQTFPLVTVAARSSKFWSRSAAPSLNGLSAVWRIWSMNNINVFIIFSSWCIATGVGTSPAARVDRWWIF